MQTNLFTEPQKNLKTEYRICPFCYSERQRRKGADNGLMRMVCQDCEREYQQSPTAQWQKFCLDCHGYIDWNSDVPTGCLCPGRWRREN